jgi:glycosyltransferase involved in cell wall biosynthesis
VQAAMREATCLLLPSRREGYGMVVIEAAAVGTPSVVVADPDNAAVELIVEGENGHVAPSADPEVVAEAITRVFEGGPDLRARTAAWFARRGSALSAATSARRVLATYEQYR